MATCDTCKNDYDRAFQVVMSGVTHTFDCFECAIEALAPRCNHCHCRIIGHGVEENGNIYCCAHCGQEEGKTGLIDRARHNKKSRMTTIRKLAKEDWEEYFSYLSAKLGNQEVQIEAIGPNIGDQIDVAGESVLEFTYNQEMNEFRIGTTTQGYLIQKPREVYVDEEVTGLKAAEIVDAHNIKYIITLRHHLELPFQDKKLVNF